MQGVVPQAPPQPARRSGAAAEGRRRAGAVSEVRREAAGLAPGYAPAVSSISGCPPHPGNDIAQRQLDVQLPQQAVHLSGCYPRPANDDAAERRLHVRQQQQEADVARCAAAAAGAAARAAAAAARSAHAPMPMPSAPMRSVPPAAPPPLETGAPPQQLPPESSPPPKVAAGEPPPEAEAATAAARPTHGPAALPSAAKLSVPLAAPPPLEAEAPPQLLHQEPRKKSYVAPREPPPEAVRQPDGSMFLERPDGSTVRWTTRLDGTWRKPEHKRKGWVGDLEREKYVIPAFRNGLIADPDYDRNQPRSSRATRQPHRGDEQEARLADAFARMQLTGWQ